MNWNIKTVIHDSAAGRFFDDRALSKGPSLLLHFYNTYILSIIIEILYNSNKKLCDVYTSSFSLKTRTVL